MQCWRLTVLSPFLVITFFLKGVVQLGSVTWKVGLLLGLGKFQIHLLLFQVMTYSIVHGYKSQKPSCSSVLVFIQVSLVWDNVEFVLFPWMGCWIIAISPLAFLSGIPPLRVCLHPFTLISGEGLCKGEVSSSKNGTHDPVSAWSRCQHVNCLANEFSMCMHLHCCYLIIMVIIIIIVIVVSVVINIIIIIIIVIQFVVIIILILSFYS